jgi:hypothetical protein
MSVRSRTTTQSLPRSVTNARLGLEGITGVARAAGHGFGVGFGVALGVGRGVGLGVARGAGEFVGVGLGSLMAIGVEEGVTFAVDVGAEPQADARTAVTTRARIQLALFMYCSGNGQAGD